MIQAAIIASSIHVGIVHHAVKFAEDVAIGIGVLGVVVGGAIFYPIGHALGKHKGRRLGAAGR